ncbi:beta-carotene 15,15'-monooxygenase [Capnocytophaga canimorsus]|uniref:Beta-carotene 15,15'-monooxygenase n=1 Tax=Capnocytophaga canimorsus TaxID=28188 RepID=A0AAC9Z3Y2_9FLAO|nr:beta-carotene 15,15'-monooxygenase [Capnocytophaga canimorsus]ATA93993.1 beta-carotene 15,15'-monooxygenase [Capnocytophaga canimorsus]
MNIFSVLFVLCSLITFGLCFLIIAKIILLYKQAQGDTSRVFQIPKGFPRYKNKWIDRLVILLIFDLVSLWMLFSTGRFSGGRGIPIEVFVENIGNYLIIVTLINVLILSLMYLFNKTQMFWLKRLQIAWYYEAILWALLLLLTLYLGLSVQSKLEILMMTG